jgi:hypothetical protein
MGEEPTFSAIVEAKSILTEVAKQAKISSDLREQFTVFAASLA